MHNALLRCIEINTMELSVVIAAHNRIEQLKRVLPSILNQDIECEMVIVDDGSRDGTTPWILTLNIPNLKLIHIATHGWRNPAYAKNLGVSCAEGEIVVVQDGEILHESSNLERIVEHFRSWDKPDTPLFVKSLSLWYEGWGSSGPIEAHFQEPYTMVGVFLAMWREDFIWIGGFNEKWFTQWGHEDVDFLRRCGFSGFKVIQDPEIKIRHLAHKPLNDAEGNHARWLEEGRWEEKYRAQVGEGKASCRIKWRH